MEKLEKINRREFLKRTSVLLSLSPLISYPRLLAKTNNKVKQISSKEQLERIISLNENIAIMFSASYCIHCKNYGPIFEEVAREYSKIVFGKIVLDKIPKKEDEIISKIYKIEYLPKTIFVHKNKEIFSETGSMRKKDLIKHINTYFLK